MINGDNFVNLTQELASAGTLPAIRFNPNCSLADDVARLVQLCDCESDNPADFVKCFFGCQEGSEKAVYDNMVNIGTTLAAKLQETLSTLRGVKAIVSDLAPKITAAENSILAQDPFASVHLGKTDVAIEFDQMPWDDINLVGSEVSIFDYANSVLNNNSQQSNLQQIGLYGARLPLTREREGEEFYSIALPDETYTALYNALVQALPDMVPDDVARALKTVLDRDTAVRLLTYLRRISLETNNVADNCVAMLKCIRIFRPMLSVLVRSIDGLDETTRSQIVSNVTVIEKYLFFCAYVLLHYRRTTFENALVLQNRMINPDNLEDFVSKNGSMLMITHHLNYFFAKLPIPMMGITTDAILSKATALDEKIKNDNFNIGVRLKMIQNEARRSAYKLIFGNYLAGNKTFDGGRNMQDVIKHAAERYVATDMVVEDAVYDFVICKLNFQDQMLQTVYKALGIKLAEQLAATTEITENDAKVLEVQVCLDIILDFVIKNFVENLVPQQA